MIFAKKPYRIQRATTARVMKILLIIIIMSALCESSTPTEVEKAFIEHGIVPDTVSVAPKNILNVSIII